MIVPMKQEYVEDWVDIWNGFHVNFMWCSKTDSQQVLDTLGHSDIICSVVARKNGQILAIGNLRATVLETMASVNDFCFQTGSYYIAMDLLEYLITKARNLQLQTIAMWSWESAESLTQLLTETGFKTRLKMSLMRKELIAEIMTVQEQSLSMKSFVDDLSIEDFVTANRTSFHDDSSRSLEVDELKEWLNTIPGFQSELQLAVLDGDMIVGTVLSECKEVLRGDSVIKQAWIYGLGVVPAFQKQGIGRYLLSNLLNRLQRNGVREVWLLTSPVDGPKLFFERLGFTHRTYWTEYLLTIAERSKQV